MYQKETEYVIKAFTESRKGDDSPLILYGIGENTKELLRYAADNCLEDENSIIGLMDSNTEGQTIYGKRVYSQEEVEKMPVKPKIVIVARDSAVSIIYNRISKLTEKGIKIYKVDGTLLNEEICIYSNHKLPYWQVGEQQLKDKIAKYDVLSFDLFDTLITRKTLIPSDVWEIMAEKKEVSAIARTSAEKFLTARKSAAVHVGIEKSLHEYYSYIGRELGLNEKQQERLWQMEFNTEKDVLLPRKKMAEIFNGAIEAGKTVVITTDMYFLEEELRELTEPLGIKGEYEMIVSCRYGCSKDKGDLFEVLKNKYQSEGKILHIGDNRHTDIYMAEKRGIDTFQIYSGYEMLMASDMQGILSKKRDLQGRNTIGEFAANMFNNPFALQGSQGHVETKTLYDAGFFFLGQFVWDFMVQFVEFVKKTAAEEVLFPSRDGWFFYNLYNKIREKEKTLPEAIYFKTSRRAATVSSIKNGEDIFRLCRRGFYGNTNDFFRERFGIEADETVRWENSLEQTAALAKKYEALILDNAEKERAGYLEYLKTLGIEPANEKKTVFFDFVAGGTVQRHMEKLLNRKFAGCYVAAVTSGNHGSAESPDVEISPVYGSLSSYGTDNPVSRLYLWLECIFTDKDNTFIKIDEKGEKVFGNEKPKDFHGIEEIHKGIYHYVDGKLNCRKPLSNQCQWDLLLYLFGEKGALTEEQRKIFTNEDSYDGQKYIKLFQNMY